MLDDLFVILIFLYLIFLTINLFAGSRFIESLCREKPDLWEAWGRPKSVFSPKRDNWELYKFILNLKKNDCVEAPNFYKKAKLLALITIMNHLTFFALILVFLFKGF